MFNISSLGLLLLPLHLFLLFLFVFFHFTCHSTSISFYLYHFLLLPFPLSLLDFHFSLSLSITSSPYSFALSFSFSSSPYVSFPCLLRLLLLTIYLQKFITLSYTHAHIILKKILILIKNYLKIMIKLKILSYTKKYIDIYNYSLELHSFIKYINFYIKFF